MTAEIHEETFDWTEADIAILENILACSGEGPLQLQYVVGVWPPSQLQLNDFKNTL